MNRKKKWGLVGVTMLAGCVAASACSGGGERASRAVGSPDEATAARPLRATSPSTTPAPQVGSGPPPRADVAELLAHPPAAGESVEIDAFYAAAYALGPFPGDFPPPVDACPRRPEALLTDRPFPLFLRYLESKRSNELPDGAAWLVAAHLPRYAYPDGPYHARFRGHLGDPAFADCPDAERIFVVEAVVETYEPSDREVWAALAAPDDSVEWPRAAEPAFGYSVAYPPDWQVERTDDGGLRLRDPSWPDYPVTVRVTAGESDPRAGTYRQRFAPCADTPPLEVLWWSCREEQGERCVRAFLSGRGRTYDVALDYPVGFDAPQALLTRYTAIVDRFQIDGMPTKTATPTPRTTLGGGPFWTRGQAERMALSMIPSGPWTVSDARLVSVAEAGRLNLCAMHRAPMRPCDDVSLDTDGVWIVRLVGSFDGRPATYYTYLDANEGHHLCTAEEGTRPGPGALPSATPIGPG